MEGHGTIMRKHHILTAVAAAAVFSLGASTLALAGEESTSGGTFTYARSDSTTSFDLHQEITENNAFAIDKVFESLVTFDNDGNIIDWLAEDHKISDDGLIYTFTLRDGLKFSDGIDVTAEDVKFSIERHLEVGGSLPIEADVKSVEAVDEKTVEIFQSLLISQMELFQRILVERLRRSFSRIQLVQVHLPYPSGIHLEI